MKLKKKSSPHIRARSSVPRIMLDVVIALIPAVIAGVWVFGLRALLIVLLSSLTAVLTEMLLGVILKKSRMAKDGSAMITGLLLALTLPVTVSWWIPVIGAAFAVIVVKGMCGGLGQNMFNPALAARALLVLMFPLQLTRYAEVLSSADAVSAATPLHHMAMNALPGESIGEMFLGNIPGSIGETSALAILIGAGYLIARRVIRYRIPAAYIGTVAIVTLIFSKGQPHLQWMLYNILGGGLLLGAVFMATDYASSSVTPKGQWIYGVGCGVLTVIFRYYGLFPEGVTYAILIMNAAAWIIDRHTAPRRYGKRRKNAA